MFESPFLWHWQEAHRLSLLGWNKNITKWNKQTRATWQSCWENVKTTCWRKSLYTAGTPTAVLLSCFSLPLSLSSLPCLCPLPLLTLSCASLWRLAHLALTLTYRGRRLRSRVPSLRGLLVGKSGDVPKAAERPAWRSPCTSLQAAFSPPYCASSVLLATFRRKHLEASLVYFVAKQNASNAPLSLHPGPAQKLLPGEPSLISPFLNQNSLFLLCIPATLVPPPPLTRLWCLYNTIMQAFLTFSLIRALLHSPEPTLLLVFCLNTHKCSGFNLKAGCVPASTIC